MASESYNIDIPRVDNTQSIASINLFPNTISGDDTAKDIVLPKAFKNWNNTLYIIFNITASCSVTFKAGNKYPNSKLGDFTLALSNGTYAVQIQDPSRFENADGSLVMQVSSTFNGSFYAIAKSTDILPAIVD